MHVCRHVTCNIRLRTMSTRTRLKLTRHELRARVCVCVNARARLAYSIVHKLANCALARLAIGDAPRWPRDYNHFATVISDPLTKADSSESNRSSRPGPAKGDQLFIDEPITRDSPVNLISLYPAILQDRNRGLFCIDLNGDSYLRKTRPSLWRLLYLEAGRIRDCDGAVACSPRPCRHTRESSRVSEYKADRMSEWILFLLRFDCAARPHNCTLEVRARRDRGFPVKRERDREGG